jgi:hypothetical protein
MRTFLHVGCGNATKAKTTKGFNTPDWDEVRFDIDPAVKPDIIGSMTDMSAVRDASVDAVFSSHNLEHLEAHEVPVALKEFKRVVDEDGFVVITCPDLQSVAAFVAKDKLIDEVYTTEDGSSITPLDILYGWTVKLKQGQKYMAHRTGFTRSSLAAFLKAAGFPSVITAKRGAPYFDLWMVACPKEKSVQEMTKLASQHMPVTPISDPVAYKKAPRIAVCVASSGQCKSQFALSLAALQGYFNKKPLMPEKPDQSMQVFLVESSSLPFNQHVLVQEARKWDATHILWVEDDMKFPEDALHQLFARRKQWVGANYAMRGGPPFEYVALNLEGERCFTGPESTGLEEVLYTGYGVTLMDISIFDKIELPYFETPWIPSGTYATTDAYLAEKVRNAGIPIYVDHDLSQKIGHVGGKVYSTQEVAAWRQQEESS